MTDNEIIKALENEVKATEYPCSHCRNCYTDKFQPTGTYSPGKGGKQ